MKANEEYKLNIKDNFNPIIYLIYEVIKVYDTVNLLELGEKIIIHNQETDKYIELIKDDWVITHTGKDIGLRVYNTNPVEPFNIKYTYSDKYYTINKKPFLIINYRNNYFVRKIIDLETFTENKKLKINLKIILIII